MLLPFKIEKPLPGGGNSGLMSNNDEWFRFRRFPSPVLPGSGS